MTRVVAIVPAYMEAGRVAPAVAALRSFCDEVVVVDDGSTDATAAEAEAAGARVVRLPRNQGKGAALAAGVRSTRADVLVFADADLAASASVVRALVAPVAAGEADMAVAAPPPSGPSGFGLVEGLARRGIEIAVGRRMARPLSGQRALRADLAGRLTFDRRFGVETGMTIDAIRLGARVVEVPCEFTHARTGRDLAGFSHRAKQGLGVAAALVRRVPASLRSRRRQGNVKP